MARVLSESRTGLFLTTGFPFSLNLPRKNGCFYTNLTSGTRRFVSAAGIFMSFSGARRKIRGWYPARYFVFSGIVSVFAVKTKGAASMTPPLSGFRKIRSVSIIYRLVSALREPLPDVRWARGTENTKRSSGRHNGRIPPSSVRRRARRRYRT